MGFAPSSHPVTGSPVAADKQPLIHHKQPKQKASTECDYNRDRCICISILLVMVVTLLSLLALFAIAIVLISRIPFWPSISVVSATMPVFNVSSDTQITADLDLEVLFNPVVNNNVDDTSSIIYERVNAMAFDRRRHGKKLLANTTIAPFEQQGCKDNRTVAVRIDGLAMDVENYEHHNYCRYGTSYMVIKLTGFARIMGGRWWKRTSNMSALCGVMKVKVPLNQTAAAAALPDCLPVGAASES